MYSSYNDITFSTFKKKNNKRSQDIKVAPQFMVRSKLFFTFFIPFFCPPNESFSTQTTHLNTISSCTALDLLPIYQWIKLFLLLLAHDQPIETMIKTKLHHMVFVPENLQVSTEPHNFHAYASQLKSSNRPLSFMHLNTHIKLIALVKKLFLFGRF